MLNIYLVLPKKVKGGSRYLFTKFNFNLQRRMPATNSLIERYLITCLLALAAEANETGDEAVVLGCLERVGAMKLSFPKETALPLHEKDRPWCR
jgi:hypothetical protein